MFHRGGAVDLATKRKPSRKARPARGRARRQRRPRVAGFDLGPLFQDFPALLFLFDARNRYLDYRAGDGLFAPPEAFVRRRVDEVLPAPAGPSFVEAMARARREGGTVVVEYSLPFPEGERHFEARLRAHPRGYVSALCTDVTARRRAEARLRDSEERFRALIDHSASNTIVFDADGVVSFASPGVTETIGWNAEELTGRPAVEFVHPDDAPDAARLIADALRSPGKLVGPTTLRLRHKGGEWRVMEAVARNLLDHPAVRGIVGNARDVTEQRRLEERYLQAQKLESLGRLAGGVAHDFNNLLVAILGYAEFLEQGIRARRPSLDDLAAIREAGERARDLTRQLLVVARRQVIEPRVIDLNDVLRSAERLLRRILGEDVALTVIPAPDLWRVKADPAQIQQVLLNLAVNARDAMSGGGKLVLETANTVIEASYVQAHPGATPGPHVLLAVSDSGPGIPPEVQGHVFEPFFTTKPAGKGTGLGLATVYGVVRQAGGHISVYSEPGQGTSFKIYLPRTAEEQPPPEPPPAPREHAGTETVLVVEDAAPVRDLAARALEAAGYRVLQAQGGREALELAASSETPIDLLLTDVVMPDLSGPKLAAALTRARPGLRVLYMSGYTENAIVHHGVLEPGIHFLPKPFTPTSLREKVRQVLDAG